MITKYADFPTMPLASLPPHFSQTTGPLRLGSIFAAIERRRKSQADIIGAALSALFMATMDYYAAHRQATMSPQLVAPLAAMHREARQASASRWAILHCSIDIIAASEAALDPAVQRALSQARAARQPVL